MKNARFFCENCGAEVPLSAKECPACGGSFASVRCPACGFTGEEDFFSNGCPVCGYTARKDSSSPKAGGTPVSTGALPLWVYVLTGIAVLGLSLILYVRW